MGRDRVGRALLAGCLLLTGCPPKNAITNTPAASPTGTGAASTTGDAGALDAGVRAGATADAASDATFALAPVLDKKRGRKAVTAYKRFLKTFCTSGASSNERVGLSPHADVCVGGPVDAVASGSFFEVGADEVLLNVPSGEPAATGDATLALMRASKGNDYRLIRHLLLSKGFSAPARIATPGRQDILMICGQWGNMGLYPSECGFLGQGTFRADAARGDAGADPAVASELSLVDVADCGHQTTVDLGEIALAGDRLSVGLVVQEEMRQEKGPKDPERDFCGKTKLLKKKQFTLTYALGSVADGHDEHGARARLLTPIPGEVQAAIDSHEN